MSEANSMSSDHGVRTHLLRQASYTQKTGMPTTGMPLSVVTKDALYKGYKPWPWPNVLVDKNISEFGKTLFTLHLFYNSHTHILLLFFMFIDSVIQIGFCILSFLHMCQPQFHADESMRP